MGIEQVKEKRSLITSEQFILQREQFLAIKTAQLWRKKESFLFSGDKKEFPWAKFRRGILEYGDRFPWLEEIISRMQSSPKRVTLLDTFAPTTFLGEIAERIGRQRLQVGIAVSLSDTRSPPEIDRDNEHNIIHISANLFDSQSWEEITKILNLAAGGQFAGFDLITCLPLGAWEIYDHGKRRPVDPEFAWSIISNHYRLLKPEGGILLVGLPWYQDSIRIAALWNTFRSHEIYAKHDMRDNSLMVVKEPKNPYKLQLFPTIT